MTDSISVAGTCNQPFTRYIIKYNTYFNYNRIAFFVADINSALACEISITDFHKQKLLRLEM